MDFFEGRNHLVEYLIIVALCCATLGVLLSFSTKSKTMCNCRTESEWTE